MSFFLFQQRPPELWTPKRRDLHLRMMEKSLQFHERASLGPRASQLWLAFGAAALGSGLLSTAAVFVLNTDWQFAVLVSGLIGLVALLAVSRLSVLPDDWDAYLRSRLLMYDPVDAEAYKKVLVRLRKAGDVRPLQRWLEDERKALAKLGHE